MDDSASTGYLSDIDHRVKYIDSKAFRGYVMLSLIKNDSAHVGSLSVSGSPNETY
jgi:hypothetical protein